MNIQEKAALERLIVIAKRDTGQPRRVANFLLSWWNSRVCGAWDVTEIRSLDQTIEDDIFVVLGLIADGGGCPSLFGYSDDFEEILRKWRPQFFEGSTEARA